MFGIELDQVFEMVKVGPSSGLNTILLILIWLNVRSLKNLMGQIEKSHNDRLGKLETAVGGYESRIRTLENSRGAI